MPTLNDAYNEIQTVNANLQVLHADNVQILAGQAAIKAALDADAVASQGISTILLHISRQADTMICALESISRNTCAILNEAHRQTKLLTVVANSDAALLDIAKTVNPGAALDLERRETQRKACEECCPPENEEPPCTYRPCPRPPSLERETPSEESHVRSSLE